MEKTIILNAKRTVVSICADSFQFDEPQVVFEGEMTAEELKSFVAKAQLPYIIEFSDEVRSKQH